MFHNLSGKTKGIIEFVTLKTCVVCFSRMSWFISFLWMISSSTSEGLSGYDPPQSLEKWRIETRHLAGSSGEDTQLTTTTHPKSNWKIHKMTPCLTGD